MWTCSLYGLILRPFVYYPAGQKFNNLTLTTVRLTIWRHHWQKQHQNQTNCFGRLLFDKWFYATGCWAIIWIIYFITRCLSENLLLPLGATQTFWTRKHESLDVSQKRRFLHDADSDNFCSKLVTGHYMCLHNYDPDNEISLSHRIMGISLWMVSLTFSALPTRSWTPLYGVPIQYWGLIKN